MKRSVWVRMFSMLLVFSLVLPIAPLGYASEWDELMIMEEVPAEQIPEATEVVAEETETVIVPETEPAREEFEQTETEETEPVQTEEEDTEPVETEAEETEPEQTEEPAASGVITTMPEGFVLSQEQLEKKQALSGESETLAELVPGEDYVADEVVFTCEDVAYAETVAQAYGGVLTSCDYGVAVIRLEGVTVAEAVATAADMSNNLPAVYANYITYVEPILNSGQDYYAASNVPRALDWESWIRDLMTKPDPYLLNPTSSSFQWMHDMVNSYQAWGVTTGSAAVKVAVVDSGVQDQHPDLKGKVTSISVGLGTSDAYGHGTHVAGIIAASMDNGIGGAGIAPGVSILNIRVLNAQGSGTNVNIARGINAAIENGAWIINLSLGGPRYSSVIEEAVADAVDAGITVVAAMGNEGNNTINYPAACDTDGVIAVVAVDKTGSRAWFSNYGKWADIAAPGEGILSTVTGSRYDLMDGTSMAAPVVSGVVALYMSAFGKVSPDEMEQLIRKNATKGNTNDLGAGIVDAAKLFGAKKLNLSYQIQDEKGEVLYQNNYKGAQIPCESTLVFDPIVDQYGKVLYTTDGKTPTIKNGEIIYGQFYDWDKGIDLSQYFGKTVTLKASYISGMGVVGKPISLKIKVAASTKISSISINGPDTLVAGKKGNYTATILPSKAEQGVNWSIVGSTGQYKTSINTKGVLSTDASFSGRIMIQAVSKADFNKKQTFTVNVQAYNPVKTVTLNYDKYAMNAGQQVSLCVAKIVDSANVTIPTDRFDVEWSTSSAKIATVDAKTGVVTAVDKGTATITCKMLDGSNKTAKCKVTVNVPVERIDVVGQYIVEPGKKVSFKANVYPSTANNKKVKWMLHGEPEGVIISENNGTVTIPKTVSTGHEFTVLALAQDGSGKLASMECRIENKCTNFSMRYAGSVGSERATLNKKGEVTALTLYSVQRPEPDGLNADNGLTTDICAPLRRVFTGSNYTVYRYDIDKPDVVEIVVDRKTNNPVIVARSKGTAKVTFSTTDGSNKKAVIKVNVINPVSGMSIQSNANRITMSSDGRSGSPIIAFGKSANNKVIFADTYGVPSNQKVSWDFTVKEYGWNTGRFVQDWTTEIKNSKLVTISNSGTLAVKAGIENFRKNRIYGEIRIAVTATAQDSTGQTATLEYYAIPKTTYLKIDKSGWEKEGNGVRKLKFTCDQWGKFADQEACAFTATSSNPALLSVLSIEPVYDPKKEVQDTYICYLCRSRDDTKGSVKITIKSADGAKSDSITIPLSPDT